MASGGTERERCGHEGEIAVQRRAGVEAGGRRHPRMMTTGVQRFLAAQHLAVVATMDADGRLWASMRSGTGVVLRALDERTVEIGGDGHPDDPLERNLASPSPAGLLAIDLAARQRVRVNGTARVTGPGRIVLTTEQVYGNCPQYIQARVPAPVASRETARMAEPAAEGRALSARAATLLGRADTFFIATAAANARGGDAAHGCDVSHRGGNPGFVRVAREHDASVLYWPDFRGNFFFNTLGNLVVNPRAGLLFWDFDTGDVLQLTGSAEVVWDGPLVTAFAGAERMLKFVPDEGVWVRAGEALRWSAPARARQLEGTGPT